VNIGDASSGQFPDRIAVVAGNVNTDFDCRQVIALDTKSGDTFQGKFIMLKTRNAQSSTEIRPKHTPLGITNIL